MTVSPGKSHYLWVIVFALLALLSAVTARSFWIDEAVAANFAMVPAFGDWLHTLLAVRSSDLQMPGYLFWIWGWEKIFGPGEYAFRMAGFPFLVAGIVAFSWRRPTCTVVCALSAYTWYYANEARPYSLQIGLSLALIGAAKCLLEGQLAPREEVFWQYILLLSGTLLGMIYMLGMFWVAAYWAFCFLCIPAFRKSETFKKTRWAWLGAFCLFLAAGCYYLWTLKVGGRASNVGTTDFRNVIFDFYELLGFGGLGPGRLDVRTNGLSVFMPYLPWLALYGMALAVIFVTGIKCLSQKMGSKTVIILLALTLAPAAFILGVGAVRQFRVLGRHLTPMLPVFLWMLSVGIHSLWQRRGLIGRAIVMVWAILALASCLEYRFAERHARDDYRSAATVARIALQEQRIVWWNADIAGAKYYKVSIGNADEASQPVSGCAWFLFNPTRSLLEGLPRPDVIIISKPDTYDTPGNVRQYVQTNHYRLAQTFTAFQIWER